MWRIEDSNGTIHSGTEGEMYYAFTLMTNEIDELEQIYKSTDPESTKNDKEKYDYDWEGDLVLIQIHATHK